MRHYVKNIICISKSQNEYFLKMLTCIEIKYIYNIKSSVKKRCALYNLNNNNE